LHNMKCETFHLKVVADCSITICSKRFTGAHYWCCPEKESYCVLHSAGNTRGRWWRECERVAEMTKMTRHLQPWKVNLIFFKIRAQDSAIQFLILLIDKRIHSPSKLQSFKWDCTTDH
jgi:hypothetical protein